MRFADIIIPLNLPRPYTYRVPVELENQLQPGFRVAVPFGKRKVYTGLVLAVHDDKPSYSDVKEVLEILDDTPIITQDQLQVWKWMANYYLCGMGAIMNAALPGVFKLQSETVIKRVEQEEDSNDASLKLSDQAFLIFEALQLKDELKIDECINIVDKKRVMPIIQELLYLNLAELQEKTEDQFRAEKETYIQLEVKSDEGFQQAFESLKRAKKQSDLFLLAIQLIRSKKKLTRKELLSTSGASAGILKALLDKGFLSQKTVVVDSFNSEIDSLETELELSPVQAQALKEIEEGFKQEKPVLLHGVTGSGKTLIYTELIQKTLEQGRDVLYILPEIGLTTQIIQRLKKEFPKSTLVYHSKFAANERARIWKHLLSADREPKLLVGARSAIFTPVNKPGLIIVDEEHDRSFKQYDPAPRYQARDLAVYMGASLKSKVLLGSATPALESHFNCLRDKYHRVELNSRYMDVPMPKIDTIDLKKAYKEKQMKAMFSKELLQAIETELAHDKQVILFQNRRGFSPMLECVRCAWTPQCKNCDISLTYHKAFDTMRCHYCGYQEKPAKSCEACKHTELKFAGFGTEKIEESISELLPKARVKRMDLDTTKAKHAHSKILHAFSNKEIDILIGTQMVSKGLDFDGVGLVAVLNADNMLNFPDFRAYERCFQTLVQVAGRAGRKEEQGKVLLQTFQPNHPVIHWVQNLDYQQMSIQILHERQKLLYPPYSRLIEITLKHKNPQTVNQAANKLFSLLKEQIHQHPVLGPAIPGIYRLRNLYQKSILIKLDLKKDYKRAKTDLFRACEKLSASSDFSSVRVNIDVDPA